MKLTTYKTAFEKAGVPFAEDFFESISECEPATLFRIVRLALLQFLTPDGATAKLMIGYYRQYPPAPVPVIELLKHERKSMNVIMKIAQGLLPVPVDKRSFTPELVMERMQGREYFLPVKRATIGGTHGRESD